MGVHAVPQTQFKMTVSYVASAKDPDKCIYICTNNGKKTPRPLLYIDPLQLQMPVTVDVHRLLLEFMEWSFIIVTNEVEGTH